MKDSCADARMATETISCSCSDVMFHCAASRVMPRHCTGTDSKFRGGGWLSAAIFLRTFTAGDPDTVREGATDSPTDVWTPLLVVFLREAEEPHSDGASGPRPEKAGEEGDHAVDERGLEYAGVASSQRWNVSRGIALLGELLDADLGPRGPWGSGGRVLADGVVGEPTNVGEHTGETCIGASGAARTTRVPGAGLGGHGRGRAGGRRVPDAAVMDST